MIKIGDSVIVANNYGTITIQKPYLADDGQASEIRYTNYQYNPNNRNYGFGSWYMSKQEFVEQIVILLQTKSTYRSRIKMSWHILIQKFRLAFW